MNGIKHNTQNGYLPAERENGIYTMTNEDLTCLDEDGMMPIAVVGIACRFPGEASSPERLWEMCVNGRDAWSKIPKNRFNVEAFYHPDGDKPGTINVQYGHFIDEDPAVFDASFFSITPTEAKAMDPQQRKLLESVYEALENGGITMEKTIGSQTSVYVGVFSKDYGELLLRDPETGPLYQATGNAMATLSNRISYFFDFKGPSITLDTACSSSLVALHLACQSLRNGEANQAVVAASNLILSPDIMISMTNLHFLSPDGRSYTYDQRANGYARGEGIASVVLKPLKEALKAGDPIRAIIRGSGVGQDGNTPGITVPSSEAQESLIRSTYRKAKLPLCDTRYFETHGTGTQVGDPLEAGAIGRVFGPERSYVDPIYAGSIKTNIGHLESASGLAGFIKAVMVLEKAVILPNLRFENPNSKLKLDEWNIRVPTKTIAWPRSGIRRASVNSFGFGGTNAHAIIDDAYHYLTDRGLRGNHRTLPEPTVKPFTDLPIQIPRSPRLNFSSSTRLRLLPLSANDELAAKQALERFLEYLRTRTVSKEYEEQFLDDLAYTLSCRRSVLPWKVALVGASLDDLITTAKFGLKPVRSLAAPKIGFVFTGQGAQWYAMGRELIEAYPSFKASLSACQKALKGVSQWSLMEELLATRSASNINKPSISQPLCTAIQIALVDLLRSWGIHPTLVVGHSSGEISAAYTVGTLDLRSAMLVSFHRGKLSESIPDRDANMKGSMLAASLEQEEAQALVAPYNGKVTVACINSPSSVTLSGDESVIDTIKTLLDQQGTFNRKLVVQAAYHSHQMNVIAKDYLASMANLKRGQPKPEISMVSSVTRKSVGADELCTAEYWVRNMLSPVNFSDALRNAVTSSKDARPDILVEIGPHSALAGPIKEILKAANLSVQYAASLTRNQDATRTMLGLARQLYSIGYPLNLSALNSLDSDDIATLRILTDLPSYAWNHSNQHWQESRLSKDYRHRKVANHPLLGTPTADHNPVEPKWRNFISLRNQPWVEDHQVASSIVYPGAGFVAMAIEALNQLVPNSVAGFRLRDVTIGKALVVTADEPVETILVLRAYNESARQSSKVWDEFKVYSYTNEATNPIQEHCRGLIAVERETPYNIVDNGFELSERVRLEDLKFEKLIKSFGPRDEVDVDEFYNNLMKAGLGYGATFRNIKRLVAAAPGIAYGEFELPDTASIMPFKYEPPHVIHPATLDTCLQTMFSALSNDGSGIKEPMVPTVIESIYISKDISKMPGSRLRTRSTTEWKGFRDIDAAITATALDTGAPLIEIVGLRCTALKGRAAIGLDDGKVTEPIRKLCYNTTWKADPNFLTFSQIEKLCHIEESSKFTRAMISSYEKVSLHYIQRAVQRISPKGDLFPYHRIFLEWMTKVITEVNDMPLLRGIDVAVDDALIQEVSDSSSEGRMLVRMGQNLPRVLNKEIDPLSLMLEDNLLYDYYREAIGTDRSYVQMQQYIDLLAHKNPSMTILEIGSGTGGASLPILQTLGGDGENNARFASYDFTDISSGFFEKAQKTFGAWGSLINYKKLDIEHDPTTQGFKEQGYDLIIAANVLHATKTIRNTMENVKKLLKPGGKLIMMELTHLLLRAHIVFGNLPGWWLGAHEGRKWGPILSADEWDAVLKDCGYTGVEGHVKEFDGDEHMCSVIISTVPHVHDSGLTDTILVKPEGSYRHPVVDKLEEDLRVRNGIVKVVGQDEVGSIDFTGKTCIFMAEAAFGLLHKVREDHFKGIQRIVSTCKSLIWVTQGAAIDSPNPHLNLVNGLGRSIRSENTSFKFITLDLDAVNPLPSEKAARTIISVYDHILSQPAILDTEFAERNGVLKVSRVTEAKDYNVAIAARCGRLPQHAEMKPFGSVNRPIRLEIGTPGLLDTLRFSELPTDRNPMGDDEVEIKISASGLNFRDVMVAMGELTYDFLGCEGSGVITKIGSNVRNVKVGDRVCTWMLGAFNSHIRNPSRLVQVIPDEMSFEIAATLPVVYCTAYYGLIDIAKLQKDETVLIHAAAGGVGQAAIMLAKWVGAEIFVTVGTLEKKKHLMDTYGLPEDHIFSSRDTTFADGIMRMTDSKGVDVVLNSLAGEQLRKSWQCISYFGRFIEMGKKDIDINSRLDMAPFIRNVIFASVDLSTVFAQNKRLGARLLKDVMGLIRQGVIKPVAPITIFPFSRVEEAFRFMQAGKHIGKVVLKPTDEPVPIRPPQEPNSELDPYASYMIVGGLGGLGKSIAQWMVKRGAKNLILISRSGSKDKARAFIKTLDGQGCRSVVIACDIANSTRLKVCIERLKREMPPIRGVIQGAMVLKDSIFEKMSVQDFHEPLRPKVNGSWNLHGMLPERLDFFIMLSSSAGIGGNQSQSNYAAANAFQDALASYRNSRGLVATTLDLGMIKGVGYVAENPEAEAKLVKWGFVDIHQEEFLAMLDYAIQNPKAGIEKAQITTGLSMKHLLDSKADELPPWASDPKFSHMIRIETSNDISTKEGQTSATSLSDKLSTATTLDEATDIVRETLVEKLSKVLVIPVEDMDVSKPTHAYGVDSLVAVELRNWLNRDAKADVPVFEIMGSKSLAELARKTAERSKLLTFQNGTA